MTYNIFDVENYSPFFDTLSLPRNDERLFFFLPSQFTLTVTLPFHFWTLFAHLRVRCEPTAIIFLCACETNRRSDLAHRGHEELETEVTMEFSCQPTSAHIGGQLTGPTFCSPLFIFGQGFFVPLLCFAR